MTSRRIAPEPGSIRLFNHSILQRELPRLGETESRELPSMIRGGVPSRLMNSQAFDPLTATRRTNRGTAGSEMSQIDAPGFRADIYVEVNFRASVSVDTLWTLRVQ